MGRTWFGLAIVILSLGTYALAFFIGRVLDFIKYYIAEPSSSWRTSHSAISGSSARWSSGRSNWRMPSFFAGSKPVKSQTNGVPQPNRGSEDQPGHESDKQLATGSEKAPQVSEGSIRKSRFWWILETSKQVSAPSQGFLELSPAGQLLSPGSSSVKSLSRSSMQGLVLQISGWKGSESVTILVPEIFRGDFGGGVCCGVWGSLGTIVC
jgi:hypothetical protein